jgi:hypothetical protein
MLRRMILMVLGAVALLPAQKAFSANFTIGGSQCHLSFNSPGPVSYFDGTIFSSSSATSFVDCPLATIAPTEAIRIHYLDGSSAGNFAATAISATSTAPLPPPPRCSRARQSAGARRTQIPTSRPRRRASSSSRSSAASAV